MHPLLRFVFLTGRVRLLFVHGQKLVPLVLGSDPLFPQEPVCGTSAVYSLHACFNHWDAHTHRSHLAHLLVCQMLRSALPSTCQFVYVKTEKRKTACKLIATCVRSTFRQDFVSCRANGKRSLPKPRHTRRVCCLFCAAGRRPCGSSLNLTAACFIITGKLSRRPQTELLLPVLNRRMLPFLSEGRFALFCCCCLVFLA